MQEEWADIQPQMLRQIEEIAFNRPEPSSILSQIISSNVELPKIRMQEQDLPQLKKHKTHIWILVHNSSDAIIKKSKDYQQFSKMYEKSKYLTKRFCVHVNKFQQIYNELKEKLELSLKCFIHAQVVLSSSLWAQVKPLLLGDLVSQIVVRSRSQVSSKMQEEKRRCNELFEENTVLEQRYSGFVENFQETIQLEKRLLNLALSKLKPNFFIINEYETAEASTILNSFHDILINTKAYLKESFDIKEKSKVQASLSAFKQFVYEEFKEKYQLLEKQRRQNFQLMKNNERKILDKFFGFAQEAINNSYPFNNSEMQDLFYNEIIILYTRETVVYTSVNNLCKTVTSKEMFMKIAFFCKFLNLAIKMKGRYDMQRLTRAVEYRILYRGAMMSEIQWNSLKKMAQTKGYIINLAFTSTSISEKIALKFYKNNVRNNILIRIKINSLFQRYYDKEPYCKYLEYYIHNNSFGLSQQIHEEEVIFNCFNVFKVIGYVDKENQIRVLQLQAFSHIQIIQKKQQGEALTQEQQKMLDVIVRIQKDKDYAQQLKEQGKTEEMVHYLQKVVDGGAELNVNQAQAYIQFMFENNKGQNVEKLIYKIQQNSQRTIQQEMKMAVYETIKEEYLQTELYLESISEKIIKADAKKDPARQSWVQLMEKSNLKHTVTINKEKIGAYEECFEYIHENLEIIHPEMQASQFLENIETWSKFYGFIIKLKIQQKNTQNLLRMYTQFVQIYQEGIRKQTENVESAALDKRILSFLQKAQTCFFLSLFDRLKDRETRQLFFNENQLRKSLQQYKNQFYERSKFKVKILIYNYQILIKSERVELSKIQEMSEKKGSQFYRNLFDRYFQTNKTFFESIHMIYLQEASDKYKYDKAIFLKDYGKFLSGFCCFYKMPERQKVKNREKIAEIFSQARHYLMEIYQEHEQLASIQNIEDNTRQERLFSERINKINSICQSLNIATSQENSISNEKELVSLTESLKNSRIQSAKRYSKKNSLLNQNLCYSSVLNITMEVVQKTILSSNLKEKYELQFQKLANKIECNTNSSVYLKQHTSNAFNDFLRASFEYYRGSYEAAMVFLRKSQEILDSKLKSTKQRIANEQDEIKKDILQKKVETIKQNNQVRIKICILKSKICINYKPNIHSLCITNLCQQKNFIKEKLFQHNSSLPQIYYYQVYLRFMLNQVAIDTLNAAFSILLPRERHLVKRQLLKYFTLKYCLTAGTQKIETENVIQEIGQKCGLIVANPDRIQIDLIEDHQHYYFFKIEQWAEQNNFSFYKIIEGFFEGRSQRVKLDKIVESQYIMLFFVLKTKLFWQVIEKIISTKFDSNILVSYRLFTAYFFYLQYLLSLGQAASMNQIFGNLRRVSTKLAVIVQNSDQSKIKYGLQLNNNEGYEDKIKVILLHVFKYTFEHRTQIPPNSAILDEEIYEEEYNRFKSKYFANSAELDQYFK